MKLGLLVTSYQMGEYLFDFLMPWYRARQLLNKDIAIVFVDGLFEGFDGETQNSNDGGLEFLEGEVKEGRINKLIKLEKPVKETEARTLGLEWLKTQNIDYCLISSPDEWFTTEQISNIFTFLESNPLTMSFKIHYKNLVFDDKHYIEGFCPSRIFKMRSPTYEIVGAYDDDNFSYRGLITRDIVPDAALSWQVIPRYLCNPRHYTWITCERSKKKVAYQKNRGWKCSFEWNEEKNCLEFNKDYYKQLGQQIPEVLKIDESN